MSKIVHRLVSETAKAIAAEVYEICASNNRFYRAYPKQALFVERCWPQFIGDARRSLTAMLRPKPSEPGAPVIYHYPQYTRDQVFEALCLEGEMKSAPPIDLNDLRVAAGMEPLARTLPGMPH